MCNANKENSILFYLQAFQKKLLGSYSCQRPIKDQYEHITPILKFLDRLPVCQRIDFKILRLIYKSLNRLGPNVHQCNAFLYEAS